MAGSMADDVRNQGARGRWRPALALAAALLLVAAMADAHLDEMRADSVAAAAPDHDLQSLAERLATRLRDGSGGAGDAASWALLARSHAVLGDHARADAAYAQATQQAPRDAQLVAERAQLKMLALGNATAEPVRQLVAQALAIDPNQALALALHGDAAYERGELAPARAHWVAARLRADAADADLVSALDRRITRLESSQRALGALNAAGTSTPAR
jgi:cytochrome c-type biogenesis protein CcmH/NrfG